MDSDSPWDESPSLDPTTSVDLEWTRISSQFTNAGYREGITAGKESALQEGFDDGFATVGVPIGRELGILRGLSSAIVSFLSLSSSSTKTQSQCYMPRDGEQTLTEAKNIYSQLSNILLADIAPRDFDAEHHAREHLEDIADLDQRAGRLQDLDDLSATNGRPTMDDLRRLEQRLRALTLALGLEVNRS